MAFGLQVTDYMARVSAQHNALLLFCWFHSSDNMRLLIAHPSKLLDCALLGQCIHCVHALLGCRHD